MKMIQIWSKYQSEYVFTDQKQMKTAKAAKCWKFCINFKIEQKMKTSKNDICCSFRSVGRVYDVLYVFAPTTHRAKYSETMVVKLLQSMLETSKAEGDKDWAPEYR